MQRPWMPFYVGDYLADTAHLTTVQHGAYLLLILSYWANGVLPESDRALATIARMSFRDWRRHRPVLQQFFYDGWKHRRLDVEISRQKEIRGKRAAAGSKGGTVTSINWHRRRK